MLGLDKDKTVQEVKRMNVIEGDGVHLSVRANRCAAVSLCPRLTEMESDMEETRSHSMERGNKKTCLEYKKKVQDKGRRRRLLLCREILQKIAISVVIITTCFWQGVHFDSDRL